MIKNVNAPWIAVYEGEHAAFGSPSSSAPVPYFYGRGYRRLCICSRHCWYLHGNHAMLSELQEEIESLFLDSCVCFASAPSFVAFSLLRLCGLFRCPLHHVSAFCVSFFCAGAISVPFRLEDRLSWYRESSEENDSAYLYDPTFFFAPRDYVLLGLTKQSAKINETHPLQNGIGYLRNSEITVELCNLDRHVENSKRPNGAAFIFTGMKAAYSSTVPSLR